MPELSYNQGPGMLPPQPMEGGEPFKKALFPINPFFHFRAVNADAFIDKIMSVERTPQNEKFLWGTRSSCDKYLCEDIEEWIPYWRDNLAYLTQRLQAEGSLHNAFQYRPYMPWINWYDRRDFQEMHDHDEHDLVGVFFATSGENFSKFYFESREFPMLSAPWRYMLNVGGAYFPKIEAGDIIFFAVHMLHGVTPHESDVTRISMSMNFDLKIEGEYLQ